MGGTVSSGENNDELVDNLVLANYITKTDVERVFRAVDRGHFFPDEVEVTDLPYRDVAWRTGHIHISAPCIYSEVMDNLELRHGLSFLNLGSGTGYLSTMAGLLLGANGVNHGVELFEDVVLFAEQRQRAFMARSEAFDRFEFCAPLFIWGNGLLLPAGTQYDRVYCGAACNDDEMLDYLKGLIKVGGILISPVHSELVMYRRTSLTDWTSKVLLPVAFANLLPAADPFYHVPVIPRSNVLSLEDLCRLSVRSVLRRNIIAEHPEFVEDKLHVSARSRMRKKRKAYSDDSDSDGGLDSDRSSHVTHRVKLDSGIVEDIDDSDLEGVDWECGAGSSETESDVEVAPTFSDVMHEKIKALELPKPLLQYLNMGRAL